MEVSKGCASRGDTTGCSAVFVGQREQTLSMLVGGFVLLQGMSRLSFGTIVTEVAGGTLLYRGLTGHGCAYRALEVSTAEGASQGSTAARLPKTGATTVDPNRCLPWLHSVSRPWR